MAENNLGVHHHMYQNNFYITVKLGENHGSRFYGKMKAKIYIQKDLEEAAEEMKRRG
jgi:hypothetical protein